MKYFVVLDESAISEVNKICPESVILIVYDNVVLPKKILNNFRCEPIRKIPVVDEEKKCREFTLSYQKLSKLSLYGNFLEIHINGIYKYVVSPLNNILYTLSLMIAQDDEIILHGGHEKIKVTSYYGIKSAEFSRNVFFRFSDVLSPLLYDSLYERYNVNYKKNFFLAVIARYFLRVTFFFLFSYVKSCFKYFFRMWKFQDKKKVFLEKRKCIVFPVRCHAHMDYVKAVSYLLSNNSNVKPVVLYYEMLMGGDFFDRMRGLDAVCYSLFSVKYSFLLILMPLFMIKDLVVSLLLLKKHSVILTSFDGQVCQMPLMHLSLENFLCPHIFIYKRLLDKTLFSLINDKGFNVEAICSSEMIGMQAFVEKQSAKQLDLKFINMQTAALFENWHPIKVVGEKMLCLDKQSADNINSSGISNQGEALYLGKVKYFGNISNFHKDDTLKVILYATQPYETDITLKFLQELGLYINRYCIGVRLRIRIHPRDSSAVYKSVLGAEIVDNKETVLDSVKEASLVLSRTSSVLYDAIELKVPFLSCILSSYDKENNLSNLLGESFDIYSIDDFFNKVKNYSCLYKNFHEIFNEIKHSERDGVSESTTAMKFLEAMGIFEP